MLLSPYYACVFLSAEAAEDGCRDEGSAGHRDASAAPGNPLPQHRLLRPTAVFVAEEC